MTQTPRPNTPPVAPSRGTLCPYCGKVSGDPRRCDWCRGFFDPLSRQATQNAMGPWFIRDASSPFRPGCSFETLRELIARGKVLRDTILRGPATRQLWNFAARTPGVANLLGICHNCRVAVKPEAASCASCGASFAVGGDRQFLGLAPIHLLPGQAPPEVIAEASLPTRAVGSVDPTTLAQSVIDDTPETEHARSISASIAEDSDRPPLFPPNSPLNSISSSSPLPLVRPTVVTSAPLTRSEKPGPAIEREVERITRVASAIPSSPVSTSRGATQARAERLGVEPTKPEANGGSCHHMRTLVLLGVVGLAALALGAWIMVYRPAASSEIANPAQTSSPATPNVGTRQAESANDRTSPSFLPVSPQSMPTAAMMPTIVVPDRADSKEAARASEAVAPATIASSPAVPLAAPLPAPATQQESVPSPTRPSTPAAWLVDLMASLSGAGDSARARAAIDGLPESASASRGALEGMVSNRQRELRARRLP